MSVVDEMLACPLFHSMYNKEIRKVAALSTFTEFRKGEIISQGKDTGVLFIVMSGRANLLVRRAETELKYRSLRSWGVAYEKMFDSTFSKQCELAAVSSSEVMILTTENLFSLYRRTPRIYGLLVTNLTGMMFRDLNTANGLIAREFFAGHLTMRIPVYISERRAPWPAKYRRQKAGEE